MKILILGIAKAGKTSWLLTLDNKTEQIAGVKPTQGVAYNQVPWAGFSMALWDVAGQEVYQKKFFIEHDRNFAGVNAIIFIFSMEEEENYKDAYALVKNLADIIEKMKMNIPITFCLHKYDPYRREMATFQKNEKDIRNKIAKIMGQIPYQVFVTSIYDRASIVRAFASTIQKCVPQFDLIQARLKELTQQFNSPMVLILDENSNIVGEWHDARNTQVELQLFTENALGFSHIISRRIYPEFVLLEMDQTWEIAAVPFPVGDKVYVALVQVVRKAIGEGSPIQSQLLAKREEFGKMLDLFRVEGCALK